MKITKGNFSCTKGQLTIRGTEYRPEGNKLPAVILSHGFNGIGGDLAHYAEQLAGWGFAAYVFDFCGGSSRSTSDGRFQDMTVFTEVQDLAVVAAYVCGLPYINSEDLTLMGCSQGGFVSALFAAAHSEVVVSRLILFYPALCIPEDARRGKMLMYAFDPSNIPEQIFPVIPEGCSDPIESLGRAYVASVQKIDAFAAIALYPGPVLIVHGDSDTAVNVINSRRAQAAYHSVKPLRCQLAEISGANHGFMGNEDVHAMELVREFIQGGTNVLSVDVVLTGFTREEQGEETVLTIPFGGVIQTPFFSGMIQPGAVDIQRWRGQEIVRLCADYIIKGTDYTGASCQIHIINEDTGSGWRPIVTTDSQALSFLNRTICTESLEQRQSGPVVRIFARLPRYEAPRQDT